VFHSIQGSAGGGFDASWDQQIPRCLWISLTVTLPLATLPAVSARRSLWPAAFLLFYLFFSLFKVLCARGRRAYLFELGPYHSVFREILGHNRSESEYFPSPTGYVLWSLTVSFIIWGIFQRFPYVIGYLPEVFSFNQLSLKLNWFICNLAASSPHS
jgi:hypothetical protein